MRVALKDVNKPVLPWLTRPGDPVAYLPNLTSCAFLQLLKLRAFARARLSAGKTSLPTGPRARDSQVSTKVCSERSCPTAGPKVAPPLLHPKVQLNMFEGFLGDFCAPKMRSLGLSVNFQCLGQGLVFRSRSDEGLEQGEPDPAGRDRRTRRAHAQELPRGAELWGRRE